MKGKIILEPQNPIDGEVIEAVVKPFGTSAHITISKKYLGKRVCLIIPKDQEFNYKDYWEDENQNSN